MIPGDKRNQRAQRTSVDSVDAGRKQVRWEREPRSCSDGGWGGGGAMGLPLHGDVRQEQPQRQGAVSGASQPGEEPKHLLATGEERPVERHQENTRKMLFNVKIKVKTIYSSFN